MAKQSLTHNGNNMESQPTAEKPEVSVIVPVYNVEPYLRRCVDSLIGQTLHNIEIILVDDGSTDGCGSICDEYAAKDARIRVIHQENAGLSATRNTGIDVAKADYLMFADSDDWVEPGFCEVPLAMAKEYQGDLVMFRYRKHQGHIRINGFFTREGVKTQEEALYLLISDVGMAAWNKLYHHELFRTNRYPKGKIYEDVVLTPVLIHEAKRIVYSSAVLYNYEYREGSITKAKSDSNARDWFDAHDLTAHNLASWGFASMAKQYLQISAFSFLSMNWNSPEISSKCLHYLRSLKHCPKQFSFKRRCRYYLCITSPRLCQLVCKVYCIFRPGHSSSANKNNNSVHSFP